MTSLVSFPWWSYIGALFSYGLEQYSTSFWVYWDSDDSEIWGVLRLLGYSEFQLFPHALVGHMRVTTVNARMEHTKQGLSLTFCLTYGGLAYTNNIHFNMAP